MAALEADASALLALFGREDDPEAEIGALLVAEFFALVRGFLTDPKKE